MSQPFVGQIALFPYNFAPRGWASCAGQLMAISQNTALFSLLGTMYGGNGTSTFALPDLQGRVPISAGQGPGLSNYTQGEDGGGETVTLLSSENAQHNHSLNATTDTATVVTASGNQLAQGQTGSAHTGFTKANVYSSAAPNTSLSTTSAISFTGGNLPHNNIQPYQVLGYYIALQGIYPARN
jgi:microcystin-dependent protein